MARRARKLLSTRIDGSCAVSELIVDQVQTDSTCMNKFLQRIYQSANHFPVNYGFTTVKDPITAYPAITVCAYKT